MEAFKDLGCPEKIWVICHPFIAKKVSILTDSAKRISRSMLFDVRLDADENGGRVDAFRHSFWMAMLSQNICWKKARTLGKAHEKSNKIDYRRGRFEEGTMPDLASSQMDLWNNQIGIDIGRNNPCLSEQALKEIVLTFILEGKMMIIKKDDNWNYLDEEGNIIPHKDWQGKWINDRCLVPSDH